VFATSSGKRKELFRFAFAASMAESCVGCLGGRSFGRERFERESQARRNLLVRKTAASLLDERKFFDAEIKMRGSRTLGSIWGRLELTGMLEG